MLSFVGKSTLILLIVAAPAIAIEFDDLVTAYGNLDTIAGWGEFRGGGFNGWQSNMEGGSATEAELSRPHMAMADLTGNVYIADKDAHAIRMVTREGTILTVAGTNEGGFNTESGLATEVQLNFPNGLYTRPNGTNYIYDLGNHRIRKLSSNGEINTLFEDPTGMVAGRGLWVSEDESLVYYSSGTELKMWTPGTGVEVLADGFSQLGNLAVSPVDGSLVVTDRLAHSVFRVSTQGDVTMIAGTGDSSGGSSGQPATSVGLDEVRGIHFHPDGGFLLATHKGGQVWFVDDEDVIHLLIDGDTEHETHYGDGLPLSSPGKKISEPRAVTFAPNGDILVTENDFGYIRRVSILEPWFEVGDFDANGELDAGDIDAMSQAVRSDQSRIFLYDVDGNGAVSIADREFWVHQLAQTTFGDANLDGQFTSRDFVEVFQAGEYEDQFLDNSSWSTGDWNGDGEFSSADFVAAFIDGGYSESVRIHTVPEPDCAIFLSVALLLIGILCRFR